jgi:hypothetical protein
MSLNPLVRTHSFKKAAAEVGITGTVLEQKYETTPLFAPHPLFYHFSYILPLQLENLTDLNEK